MKSTTNRRQFVKTATLTALGGAGITSLSGFTNPMNSISSMANELNVLGPMEGYTPHVGSLVSMLNWMRFVMLRSVEGMGTEELDYLIDDNANSIGAMLYHLAATDKLYYLLTIKNIDPNKVFDAPEFASFRPAMELGNTARNSIKGNDLTFYLDVLTTTREETLAALADRDDDWLMEVDKTWSWGPTNNYCKWFHVCEHESNHNGQIKLIKSRIS